MTFKPKKQQIHVPGYGVVQKEDFNEKHFNVLMKRAGDNKDAFIKQHLEVESFGDLPLFEEDEATRKAAEALARKQEKERLKAKKKAEEERLAQEKADEEARKAAEEAELLAEIAKEEAAKKELENQTGTSVE